MQYPEAPPADVAELVSGQLVRDPYRWLEDSTSAATLGWQQAQGELLGEARARWSSRPAILERLRALTPGAVSSPVARGGRFFFSRRDAGQEHSVYWVREPDGRERPLVDPARLDPSLTTVMDGAAPSPAADRLAYLLSGGGREESSLFVLDVDSAELVEGPILLGRGPDLAWSHQSDELFYVRRVPDSVLPPGEEQFHRRVWRHRVGTGPDEDELLFGDGRDKTTYYDLHASTDGAWLRVAASLGTAPRNDVYLLELATGRWSVVQEGCDWETHAWVAGDGRLYLFTNRQAPRWRLCVADPLRPTEWTDLLAEGEDVLTDVAVTDEAVVAVRTHDVVSQVTVHDRSDGSRRGDLPLPGLGVADVTSRPEGGDRVWIGYSDYTTPRRVIEHHLPSGDAHEWGRAPVAASLDAVVERHFVASKDGTAIPLFVMTPPGAVGPRPTLLYGYGGFNVALPPAYSARLAAWVASGGVAAVANLRGGSEYGEEWHRAGMRDQKQNVFDDFLAAAQWLIDHGHTDRRRLGLVGGSNGGLLVGAALTQRPDLIGAVVCSAPLLDMVRYEHFGLGQTWNDEYGSAERPDELQWLLSYSPYHHVSDGVAYPAVLFTVFDGDTRVDPLHARKMAAALQAATSSPPSAAPVLFRLEQNVGHGARAVSLDIELMADELGFLAHQLGLDSVPGG